MATNPSTGSSFSCNGTYFALLSVDNRLRIWDVVSGKLLREFSSASHVESKCTCLCWVTDEKDSRNKDGKKRKQKSQHKGTDNLSNILIGYSNGTILLYNSSSDQQDLIYNDGHYRNVNCISYDPISGNFYSCSDDKHITEWSVGNKEMISKWKGGKSAIKMVAVGPSGKTILSAGTSIKLWDLETKNEIMRFDGHSSPVSLLQFSGYRKSSKKSNGDDGCYFLSGSTEDRMISAWHINYSQPTKSTIATFMTSDVPVFMNLDVNVTDNRPIKLAVGCRDGKVYLFVCSMNGKQSRPIDEFKILSVMQREGEKSNVNPATLLAGVLNCDSSFQLMFASGNSLRPDFTDYNFSTGKKVGKIIKDVVHNMFMTEQVTERVQTVDLAELRGRQHVIGSTYAVPKLDNNANVEDRQRTEDLSMTERLKEAGLQKRNSLAPGTTSASSFSVLLIQGLHTNDTKLVNEVLMKKVAPRIVRNTVKRIPTSVIIELLNLIVDKIQYNPKPIVSNNLAFWIRTILTIHLSTLSMIPNVSVTLQKLFTLLKAQQEVYPYIFSLQGKIDLLLSQVTTDTKDEKQKEEEEDDLKNPCLHFHDDSDDDDDLLDRIRKDSENTDNGGEQDDENESGDEDEEEGDDVTSDDEMEDDNLKDNEIDSGDDSGTY